MRCFIPIYATIFTWIAFSPSARLLNRLRAATVVPKGSLKLTCAVTFGVRYLAPAIAEFSARHPQLQFELPPLTSSAAAARPSGPGTLPGSSA